jgi:hypothetical protein
MTLRRTGYEPAIPSPNRVMFTARELGLVCASLATGILSDSGNGGNAPLAHAINEEEEMSTLNVWEYRSGLRTDLADQANLVGYDVEATDGSIGKIDEASAETSRQYLVVDTGFWIFGKKRLIPAGVVTRVDHVDRKVYVSMTKDQIKRAPDYDDAMTSYDDAYYDKYSSYYSPYGS